MNEGDSAGGGHQGLSPAPPAVPDRRSTFSTVNNQTTPTIITIATTHVTTASATATATLSAAQSTTVTTTSARSFQQVFTQQQLQLQQQQQHQSLTPLSGGSAVINSSSVANNQPHHHMQQASTHYVAGVAATVSNPQQQQQQQQQKHQQQRIFVTQIQTPTVSSYSTSALLTTTSTARTYISSTVGAAAPPSATTNSTSLSKRLKIDSTTTESVVVPGTGSNVIGSLLPIILSTSEKSSVTAAVAAASPQQNVNTLKKLIIEQKYLRLRNLKEKYSEHVAELFYLQSGGNMMDYPTWKKKPPSPQFINFCNAYRLDLLVNEDRTSVSPATAANITTQQQQTAENIATIIGVNSLNQQGESATTKTNTQSQLSSVTELPALARKRSFSVASSTSTGSATTSLALPTGGGNTVTAGTEAGLPQGAEIKISAVGATPVAVSTQLPAAVVQLSQQGHIPGRPLGGRHGMVFGQIPVPPAVGNSSIPLVPGGTPLLPCGSTTSAASSLRRNGNGVAGEAATIPSAQPVTTVSASTPPPPPPPLFSPSADGVATTTTANGSALGYTAAGSNSVQEFSFKAKQEVYVMQRVSELQREGLWTEKRLPKLQEPSRPKAHWDYLLEEMVWLAADFAQERKWKKNAAKKCAKMVQKYFQDKANAAQKAEKAHELHLKRIASFISKEIKMFWSNVEKLVEYKHHTKLEEKRKKALDQHLSFIVDQTEKFSQQLAEGMNKSIMDTNAAASVAASMNSSRKSSPKRKDTNISDDEFRPVSSSEDDEETIAKAEEEAADVNEEVAALAKESQMDLDDFLNDLPAGYLENRDKIVLEEKMEEDGNETDDVEFEANEASEDDENTISQQEAEESELDHKKELDELEADNDLTVEELMKKYKSKQTRSAAASNVKSSRMEIDSDDDKDPLDLDDDSTASESECSSDETVDETAVSSDSEAGDNDDGLKRLLEDNDTNKDDMIKDAAALAESIQPKGNTLSSTNVVTPVPFLLKHTLREYQHIGLDWLVTMHDRKLNGILADEMGLGKTIQTIALLAHLACVKGNWGPHLIVVPSSVMLNWEMEFKKWCPAFKILTYYGTQKERKLKRVGWTKPNAFHVCITSYKLVVQDQQSFRRKKWKYLILDEAQNIKNFKSQRWQLLLNFSTERRLLLTGTPLQNDLMELWSLMHFLMPYVFSSHREFKEWFSNPMTGMIEGNMEYNESLINRLHKVIRPFLLRRLKKEVEKQMPKKYEHVVMCRLSNRQRYLYDDFMSRSKTKETLQTGNLLSVINVLMQLRKVCNHPNMFEVRPTISPFQMEGISYHTARLVCDLMEYDPFVHIDLHSLNLLLIQLELTVTAYVSHKSRLLAPPRKLIEEIDTMPPPPPRCPSGKYKFHIRIRDQKVQKELSYHNSNIVKVGTSPAMKTDGNKFVPIRHLGDLASNRLKRRINSSTISVNDFKFVHSTSNASDAQNRSQIGQQIILGAKNSTDAISTTISSATTTTTATSAKIAKLVQSGKPYFFLTSAGSGSGEAGGGRLTLVCKTSAPGVATTSANVKKLEKSDSGESSKNTMLVTALAQKIKTTTETTEMDIDKEALEKKEIEVDATSEMDPLYNQSELIQKRKEKRLSYLKLMSSINKRRSEAVPIYGSDCRDTLMKGSDASQLIQFSNWHTRGYTNCRTAMERSDNWTLGRLLKSYERRCEELRLTFANYVIYVPSVCAPRIKFYIQHLTSNCVQREKQIETTLTKELSPKLSLLHPIISAMNTQFPDPRLIQYDCGKLQTLDRLLRQLKSGQHRILIFTQMTKMLDVLEAFLNHHGHIYLRLDGSTKVEQRQVLMERFNGDKRIFCFILSTRSGGVGINLTGADTVIFYDSDWNPTMDAQAQDRCHRIGQTRDVHIYRLVSEKTIEVNILKKANQKRMLSDMAIEGGNFTTSFFKSSTIKDLFNIDQQERDLDIPSSSSSKPEKLTSVVSERPVEVETEKQSLRVFESALAAAEDEQDVQATKTAKAEVAADLEEFDETIPIDDATEVPVATNIEMSKADIEVQNLVKQLSPIERYAMRFVEETGAAWTAEQLRAAEEELEAQKREWEANRLAALQKEEEMLKQEMISDEMLTYSRKDANNQVWISSNTMEQMPMWCPPTPPQNDNDIYIDYSLSFMYETKVIPESELPPVYVKKDFKRSRSDAGFMLDGSRRPTKIRKEDNFFAPRSLFDRPSPAIAKIRRDLKLQRWRGVFKPNVQIPGLKPPIPQKPPTEPDGMIEWCIYEDLSIVYVLANIQGLPLNLMPLSPGHTTNWDLVAEIVNLNSKAYRSPKQCRWRYESVVLPREEGKIVESPKKHKKLKTALKSVIKGPIRSLKTAQMFANDNNMSFIKLMRSRFDCIKSAYLKKAPPPKRHFSAPSPMNPKHAEVLQEFGISNYDQPISPLNIAIMKANKMREKQRCHLPPPQAPAVGQQAVATQQHQELQQQNVGAGVHSTVGPTSQQIQIQQTGTTVNIQQPAIVLQQSAQQQQQQQQPQVVTQSTAQGQTLMRTTGNHQSTTQIVKAIVAPQSGLLTAGQMQQLTQQAAAAGAQQIQLQQTSGGNLVATPASVSVVLSTPVQTISSNVQHHGGNQSSTAQIVSITPQTIVSSSSQMGTIVQTIPSQSLPQVVSVSQLATVGTVLTTSANVQPNATVTTLNTSALRAQRIVAATAGTLQDVVLQQRPSNQSPTIVSMSTMGQNVTPAQFQAAAQLRLASGGTQQVVTKGIPVSSLQQTGKITTTGGNQPAQIQLYRQRQQLKVLQSGQGGQTVVQTANGQTALVNSAGTIIQGGIVQTSGSGPGTVQMQGQKVGVATVPAGNVANSSGGVVTSVATVQVAHNQGRAQFIKQVAGKQTIARQVTDNEMLLVKRQVIGAHQKAQVLQQGQIFTTAGSVQLQQAQQQQQTPVLTASGSQQTQQQVTHQQIATLVKTSSGGVTSSTSGQAIAIAAGQHQGTVNMALSHLKPGGQIKVTMANQSQMRQLHMQQHLAVAQPRKISKMTQLAAAQANAAANQQQISNQPLTQSTVGGATSVQKSTSSGGVQTQLVHIQNTKSLPGSVTVQQIQQVMRQGQQGTLSATGLVLGKTSVGRVIPVSVASQPNQRQTIQVVSAASAQAIAAGNMRAHVAGGQNIAGTIKVASAGAGQGQTQQALITAIQQQAAAQQSQRQNASPVRLQTTVGGNLVAVVQQQPQQQQQQQQQLQQQSSSTTTSCSPSTSMTSSTSTQAAADALTITQTTTNSTSMQQPQLVTTPQQVRTLVKKKIMQIRSEKE